MEAKLKKTLKHIKLKTYNKTVITQLGTCAVVINYKDNKRKCEFFVVPGNDQVLLGMPDTAAPKIININIDCVEVVCMRKVDCNTNMGDTKEAETRQEDLVVMESCKTWRQI